MDTITDIGYLILAINFILYLLKKNKNKELPYKVFILYLFVLVSIQLSGEYVQKFTSSGNNLFLTHYYFILQNILLSYFYYLILKSKKVKQLIKFVLPLTLASLTIQYSFFPELYYVFNVFEIFVCLIPLVIYALSHLFQTLGSPNKKYIYITSGILIFFLPHALVFSSGNLMPDLPTNVNKIIWYLNIILVVVFQLLIFIEWYKHFRKVKVPNH
jgi:hypothetical protein